LAPTSRSSFKSVSRLMTFGNGSLNGGSYMFSCQIRCTFQLRHLTLQNWPRRSGLSRLRVIENFGRC
jgi:hypothetical protein